MRPQTCLKIHIIDINTIRYGAGRLGFKMATHYTKDVHKKLR